MNHRIRFSTAWILCAALGFIVPVWPQSERQQEQSTTTPSKRRQEQIKDLMKKSDLVAVATAQAYYPIIDIEKYRLERMDREVNDPRRRSTYTMGTLYKLSVKEVLFQKPAKDSGKPGRTFYPDDALMIYIPGPLVHPLDSDKVTFLPSADYLVFLRRIRLDPDDFERGMRQDLNAPMRDWEGFPNPVETYFEVIRDPFAAKYIDEVWQTFVDQTRTVIKTMNAER
jgi:hypothetical protein